MRLAVFTNQFPTRVATFFARDMRSLIESGLELDIFPFYPLDADLWSCVPTILDERALPRDRIHHVGLSGALRLTAPRRRALPTLARDAGAIAMASLPFGAAHGVKTAYVALKALALADHPCARVPYDHVLAYWGNHAATYAYLFHRLTRGRCPFSMIVHARMDLYTNRAYLGEKMLYADNVFVVCEFNRGYIADRFASIHPSLAAKIHVHHLGLDLDDARYEPDGRPANRIVAIGRLEPLKGYHVLLEAVHALRQRGVIVEVELVGGGEAEGELRALALRLGVLPQVRFRGWVPPADAMAAMRGATVFVHPPVALDAMPTVLKEAIAVGTPVIASDLAGAPEILDHGRAGLLVRPGDAGALASAIERLLADAPLRRRLAEAGRRHAERTFDLWRNGAILAERLRTTRRPGSPG